VRAPALFALRTLQPAAFVLNFSLADPCRQLASFGPTAIVLSDLLQIAISGVNDCSNMPANYSHNSALSSIVFAFHRFF
jgi:hypothetical protein